MTSALLHSAATLAAEALLCSILLVSASLELLLLIPSHLILSASALDSILMCPYNYYDIMHGIIYDIMYDIMYNKYDIM